MATENKITKRDMFEHIAEAMAEDTAVVEFCEKEIAALDAKKAKAAERAAEKRAAGDELQAAIAALLTDEPQTAEDILAQLDVEDLTKQKVIARMTNLVKFDQASKCDVKVEINGKATTRKAYTLPVADADAE